VLDRELAVELFSLFAGNSVEYTDSLALPDQPRQQIPLRLTQSQIVKRFFVKDTLVNVHFPFLSNSSTNTPKLVIYSKLLDVNRLRSFIEQNEQIYLNQFALLEIKGSSDYPGLFYLAQQSNSLRSFVNKLEPGKYPVTVSEEGRLPVIALVTKIRNQPIVNPFVIKINESISINVNQWEFPFDYDLLNEDIKQFTQYIVLDPDSNSSDLIGLL
jgi:hypothetical protein